MRIVIAMNLSSRNQQGDDKCHLDVVDIDDNNENSGCIVCAIFKKNPYDYSICRMGIAA